MAPVTPQAIEASHVFRTARFIWRTKHTVPAGDFMSIQAFPNPDFLKASSFIEVGQIFPQIPQQFTERRRERERDYSMTSSV